MYPARGIDNTPGAEHEAHIISSGYRGPKLNAAVGGSSTSAHCHGYAFDLVPTNGKMKEFKRFCREFLADKAFDQLISDAATPPVSIDDRRKVLSHD